MIFTIPTMQSIENMYTTENSLFFGGGVTLADVLKGKRGDRKAEGALWQNNPVKAIGMLNENLFLCKFECHCFGIARAATVVDAVIIIAVCIAVRCCCPV